MVATLRLVAVRCPNPYCPHARVKGKPALVGELEPGSRARLKCPSCRELALYTAPLPKTA